ncbi:MAG: chemotaxis protein CheW [Candidatus Kapabacteria bacterium]|nr:chemotaxis protein CheW [Candidatus Kapabacteria bacterium]
MSNTNSSYDDDDDIYDDIDDTQDNKFLTFLLNNENFAIEIEYIIEIIGIQKITHIPDLPLFIKGIVNLRGKVIPIIDLRMRFGFEQIDFDERTCIIILNFNEQFYGIIVDRVLEVVFILEEDIDKEAINEFNVFNKFIKNVSKFNDKILANLDVEKVIDIKELSNIKQNSN